MTTDSSISTRSANIIHAVSIFVSVVILGLSVQDCGILSLCLNPLFAVLTVFYDIAMLVQVNRRLEDAQVLSIWYTISAYLLSLGWLGAYISMAVVLSSRETELTLFNAHLSIPQTLRSSQRTQMLLDPLEFAIIGNIAIRRTMERLRLCKLQQMHFLD